MTAQAAQRLCCLQQMYRLFDARVARVYLF